MATTAVAAVLVVGLSLGGYQDRRLLPGNPRPEPQIIGFYQNGWSRIFQSSFPSVKAHYQVLDTVLAFWYSLDGSGTLHANAPQPSVTQWIKRHHMRMGVLINNIPGPSGNNAGMLTDPTARGRGVQAIATMVKQQGYQEVNIDFELLHPSARAGLTAFMQELRAALPSTVTLSESVFPRVGVPTSLNGAYDYTALAKAADYLVIMLYDNHSSGGPAGPVSPNPWVVDNMNWFLHQAGIPASRLVLAAGVYGYDWPVGSTTAKEMPLTEIDALMRAQHAQPMVDQASGNPFFRYTASDGTRHVVWYQDSTTVQQRLQLAQRLGLHGLAIWALGEETPGVWGVLEQTWKAAQGG